MILLKKVYTTIREKRHLRLVYHRFGRYVFENGDERHYNDYWVSML